MKRGTPQHPKVASLAAKLDVPLYSAVGVLELLWHFTAQYAPQGDVGKHTDEAIAAYIGWNGSASELISALVTTRWLDSNQTHRLLVHDWPEHCEDSVRMALARKTLLFAQGSRPSMSRLGKDERKLCEDAYLELERTRNAQHTHGNAQETHCPPLPSPPLPSPPLPPVVDPLLSEVERIIDPVCELVNAWPSLMPMGMARIGPTQRKDLETIIALAGGVAGAKEVFAKVAEATSQGKSVSVPIKYALGIAEKLATEKDQQSNRVHSTSRKVRLPVNMIGRV